MTFWLNGDWCGHRDAIGIDDRGFLLGDGVFETILVRHGAPVFLEQHLSRLMAGLKALAINAVLPGGVSALIAELAQRNGFTERDAALRLTVTRGGGGRGLAPLAPADQRPNVLATIAPAPAVKPVVDLMISSRVRASFGIAAQAKTLCYLENILARREAAAAGADDALMLNEHGRAVSASVANIFLIEADGALITPPLSDGALPGVVRAQVMAAAAAAGLKAAEQSLSPDQLRNGAMFLTNSLIGLSPARLDGGRDARDSEIFARVKSCYRDAVVADLARERGL